MRPLLLAPASCVSRSLASFPARRALRAVAACASVRVESSLRGSSRQLPTARIHDVIRCLPRMELKPKQNVSGGELTQPTSRVVAPPHTDVPLAYTPTAHRGQPRFGDGVSACSCPSGQSHAEDVLRSFDPAAQTASEPCLARRCPPRPRHARPSLSNPRVNRLRARVVAAVRHQVCREAVRMCLPALVEAFA